MAASMVAATSVGAAAAVSDASHKTEERTLPSTKIISTTEIISGTTDISFSELTELGYYHGPVDGQIGPETERAIRSFQSVDKLSVTGPTFKALGSPE
jgi:hypothetical protein